MFYVVLEYDGSDPYFAVCPASIIAKISLENITQGPYSDYEEAHALMQHLNELFGYCTEE